MARKPAGSSRVRLGPPVTRGVRQGRTDMGVDYSGQGYVLAVLDGVVTYVGNETGSGAAGGNGPFVIYKTRAGYVYVAEQWTPGVKVGDRVKQGQRIGKLTGGHIEMGWAAGPTGNWNTAAKAGGGYREGQVTAEGKSFADAVASGYAPVAAGSQDAPLQAQSSTQLGSAAQPDLTIPSYQPPAAPPNPFDTVAQPSPPGASGLGINSGQAPDPAEQWRQIAAQPVSDPLTGSFAQQVATAQGGTV